MEGPSQETEKLFHPTSKKHLEQCTKEVGSSHLLTKLPCIRDGRPPARSGFAEGCSKLRLELGASEDVT